MDGGAIYVRYLAMVFNWRVALPFFLFSLFSCEELASIGFMTNQVCLALFLPHAPPISQRYITSGSSSFADRQARRSLASHRYPFLFENFQWGKRNETMPIRNPFARRPGIVVTQDENVRPGSGGSGVGIGADANAVAHPGFERQDTVGSKASTSVSVSALSIRSRRSQDTGEYKMSGRFSSQVFYPVP